MSTTHKPAESLRHIEEALELFPALAEKIHRTLLLTLHSRGIVSIDQIQLQARERIGQPGATDGAGSANENVQSSQRWDELEKIEIQELTREYASAHLSPDEIDDVVNLTRKREEAQRLEEIANLSTVSYRLLADTVKRFCRLPAGQTQIPEWESVGVRVALTRHFISDQLEFIAIAKNYLKIRDFNGLVDNIFGDDAGMGRIGGKAAGMILAHRILERARQEDPTAPRVPVTVPESYFLRSDVIEQFLEHNDLKELQSQKYKPLDVIRQEYPVILKLFKNAQFPPAVVPRLRSLLERVGTHPLIVRSSSLLEDRFGATFAGKYRSIFVPNQGPLEKRLSELTGAIAEVYASIMHPDPISYRRRHNLIDYDDAMAVLIQKVVGQRYGKYFFPLWAGVAFSRNEFRWSPRIQRSDGLARIVLGIGTRAVDRVASDYPRMIALGMPTLRPVASKEEIRRYSQRYVDVINLETNSFETLPLHEVLGGEQLPGVHHAVSVLVDGELRGPTGTRVGLPSGERVVTFDYFVRETPYPEFLRWMVQLLEKTYGCPMDVEFAFDGQSFYLLQCRPQAWNRDEIAVRVPAGVAADSRVFSATRNITTGSVHGIEYVVLIDPRDYAHLGPDRRQEIAGAVRLLNDRLRGRAFILMGPGRWGSNDSRLGIRAGYADINNAAMLIEIARAKGDHVPEVSFGTHFFQDLVESKIRYLALYPDTTSDEFNERFLHGSPNVLPELSPELGALAGVVRVVDVRRASGGMLLNVDMDGDNQLALGYLAPPGKPDGD
ncbi:MAG: PEP/pyruvate-binding domain-containing protein [Acidobacteria bacterium]|nr:PEP/pyruvate-binding domain-containing protein [Acidobacteriota bacterium]